MKPKEIQEKLNIEAEKIKLFKRKGIFAPENPPSGAIDGVVGELSNEWASAPSKKKRNGSQKDVSGEWIKLEWDKKQTIERILLFDRLHYLQQICGAMLLFSDGSHISIDKELPPQAFKGLEISFESKEVDWVMLVIQKHGWSSSNPGLSEFAVF